MVAQPRPQQTGGGTGGEHQPGPRKGIAGKRRPAYPRDADGDKICALHRLPDGRHGRAPMFTAGAGLAAPSPGWERAYAAPPWPAGWTDTGAVTNRNTVISTSWMP